MPLQTETYNLEDEKERIESELSDLNDIIAETGNDNPALPDLQQLKQTLNAQKEGIEDAMNYHQADAIPDAIWGEDDDIDAITLSGLDSGDTAKMQDGLPSGVGQSGKRLHKFAAGIIHPGDDVGNGKKVRDVDHLDASAPAPFAAPMPGEQSIEERLSAVNDLTHGFIIWAEARIEELSTLSGNGRPNYDELAGKVQAMASDEAPNSTT